LKLTQKSVMRVVTCATCRLSRCVRGDDVSHLAASQEWRRRGRKQGANAGRASVGKDAPAWVGLNNRPSGRVAWLDTDSIGATIK